MNDVRPLWGLVLAGGRSRRMGSDKAYLQNGGQSQLARSVALLESLLERVFVSARGDQQEDAERRKYALIIDRYNNLGPVAGILSAMDAHPNVDWLVLACDLPNVDDRTIRTLLDKHRPGDEFTAFASSFDGLPEPLCAVYGQGARGRIAGFVDEGLKCPRKMLIRSDIELLTQPHPDALLNVNAPEDLAGSGVRIGS